MTPAHCPHPPTHPLPVSSAHPPPFPRTSELVLNSVNVAVLGALFNFGASPRPSGLGVKEFSGRKTLALCPSTPNCISTAEEANDMGHYVPQWSTGKKSTADAMADLVEAVNTLTPDGFTPKIITQTSDYLYAEYESPTFGFIDDVEFLIQPACHQGGGVAGVQAGWRARPPPAPPAPLTAPPNPFCPFRTARSSTGPPPASVNPTATSTASASRRCASSSSRRGGARSASSETGGCVGRAAPGAVVGVGRCARGHPPAL